MSKTIILIFFITAFIIFYIFKYASKGVKKAYNHTIKQDEITSVLSLPQEKIERIVNAMLASIRIQTNLAYDRFGKLTDVAKDNWSIGYIGGFADAILQKSKIDIDITGHIVMHKFFCGVFGEGEGFEYFEKYSNLMETQDEAAINGSNTAGNEVFNQFQSNGKMMPLGLMKHITEKQLSSN